MKYEKSCGAILFREFPEGWKTLLLRHNQGHWAFAKGHVEGNETEEQTALREILEETGLTAQLDTGFRMVTTYSPQPDVQKDVIYFIARVKEGSAVPQLEEIQTLEWQDFDSALKILTFKNDKDIFEKAVEYFQQTQA